MRLLIAGLLTLAAFTAPTPNAAAVYICGHQTDAQDLVVGDDPVLRSHCTTENINQVDLDCEVTVTVTTDGITYPATCDNIEDFLSPDAGCSSTPWPPHDCVQDCDGPATE